MPGRFRKRPVVITAHRFFESQLLDEASFNELADFIGANYVVFVVDADGHTRLKITTLEGDMFADSGDWLIRGVKGELYPCKDDIFRATYEPVEEEE